MSADLEAIVQKRLANGGYRNAEEVLRRALEAQEEEESWSEEDRHALEEKIDRAMEQFATGKYYEPEEALQKLAEMRSAHLAKISR